MWPGWKTEDAGEIIAGDIGSVSKLGNVLTGDTLSASGKLAAARWSSRPHDFGCGLPQGKGR
ncbi:MAG: hypothetical protein ACLR56_12305 [Oscillospiraceae bacterium]